MWNSLLKKRFSMRYGFPRAAHIESLESRLLLTTYLSDLTPTSQTNGRGPAEHDITNGSLTTGDGVSIILGGKQYAKGIGVYPVSDLVYTLSQNYQSFKATIGLDSSAASGAQDLFEVFVGTSTHTTETPFTLTAGTSKSLLFDLRGQTQLELKVLPVSGVPSGGAVWAGAELVDQGPTVELTDIVPKTTTGTAIINSAMNNAVLTADGYIYGSGIATQNTTLDYDTNGAQQLVVTPGLQDNPNDSKTTPSTATFTITGINTTTSTNTTLYYSKPALITLKSPTESADPFTAITVPLAGYTTVELHTTISGSAQPLWLDPHFTAAAFNSNTTDPNNAATQYLSDLTPTSNTQPFTKDTNFNAQPIKLSGVTYPKGIATSTASGPSDITYALNGQFNTFQAEVGIDDAITAGGSAKYDIFLNGVMTNAVANGTFSAGAPPVDLFINVVGATSLTLEAKPNVTASSNGQVDFANARLTNTGGTSQNAGAGTANVSTRAEHLDDFFKAAETSVETQQWFRTHVQQMEVFKNPFFTTLQGQAWYPETLQYYDAQGANIATNHDSSGALLNTDPSSWFLQGIDPSTGMKANAFVEYGSPATLSAYNISNPDFQRDYIRRILQLADWTGTAGTEFNTPNPALSNILGIWLDDVNMDLHFATSAGTKMTQVIDPTGKYQYITPDEYKGWVDTFMNGIRQALPSDMQLSENSRYYDLWTAQTRDNDQSTIQKQLATGTQINLEHEVNDVGLVSGSGQFGYLTVLNYVDQAHAEGDSVVYNGESETLDGQETPATYKPSAQFTLATYYLTSNGKDFIANSGDGQVGSYGVQQPPFMNPTQTWDTTGQYWTGYDIQLGTPTTPRYFVPGFNNAILERQFTNGIVVAQQPNGGNAPVAYTLVVSGHYVLAPGTISSNVTYNASTNMTTIKMSSGAGYVLKNLQTTAAAFIQTDSTTVGNWRGVYGSDGYGVLGGTATDKMAPNINYPRYADVAETTGGLTDWSDSTGSLDALLNPAGTNRVAWAYSAASPNPVTLDVNLNDNQKHLVTLYFYNRDETASRSEKIQILDANSGAVLNTQTVVMPGSQSGIYESWNLTGHVKIVVTDTGTNGDAAVVSGLFFDPSVSVQSQPQTMAVNDGSAQRSSVKSVNLTFATPVTLTPGAIQVASASTGVNQPVTLSTLGPATSFTATFNGTSLADGNYIVTVLASGVHNSIGQSAAQDSQWSFFRYFGDADGDGSDTSADSSVFAAANGKRNGQSGYLWWLDYDGNNVINATDQLQFNTRLNHSVT